MIRIGIGGKVLSPDELRAIGWTLIDAGNAQDRYAVQLDLAASVAIRHAAKLRTMLQGLRA